MYEYEVKLTNGEDNVFMWGYSLKDACRRRNLTTADVECVYFCEYID